MPYLTLLDPATLAPHLADPQWLSVDCRFDLAQPGWGEAQYRAAHVPGAVYADLERALSGAKTGRNGRHPLPNPHAFEMTLRQWGVEADTQIIAYDQANGLWASRLWWLLRHAGHRAVAVLEGGWKRWTRAGYPLQAEAPTPRAPSQLSITWGSAALVTADEVTRIGGAPPYRLIDVRAPERYRGEVEPIDPVAGHIPGAVNHFNLRNVQADGTFLAPEILRAQFLETLGDTPPEHAIAYCGSGVAAAHTVLAMEVAGLPGAAIYAGSWSEWCSDTGRGVEKSGPAPA